MNSTLLLLILVLIINSLLYTSYQEHFGLFRKDRRYYNLHTAYLSSSRRLRYESCLGLSLEEHFERFINCPFLIRTRTIPPPGISLEAIANLLKSDMDMIQKYSKKKKIGTVAILITTLDDLAQTIHFLFPNFMKIRYVIAGEEEPEEIKEDNLSFMDRIKGAAARSKKGVTETIEQITEKAVAASRYANQTVDRINSFMKDANETQRKQTRAEALQAIQKAIDNRKLESNVDIPENAKQIIIEPVKSKEFIARYHRWFFSLIYTKYTQSGSRCHHPKIFQCPGIQPFSYRTGNWLFGRKYYYYHTPCGTNSLSQKEPSLIPTIDRNVFYTLYNPNPTFFPDYEISPHPNLSMMTEYDEMLYDCEFMMVSENRQFVCYLQRGFGLCIYYLVPQVASIRGYNRRVPGARTYIEYINSVKNNVYLMCRSDPGLNSMSKRLIFRIPLTSPNYGCFKILDNTIFLIDSYEGTDDFGINTWFGRTALKINVNADSPIMLKLSNLGVLKIIDAYDREYGELSGEEINKDLTPDSDYKCSTFGLDGIETSFKPGAGTTAGMKKNIADLMGKLGDFGGLGDGLGLLAKEVDPSLLDGSDKTPPPPTSDASGRVSGSEYSDARDRLRAETDKSNHDKKEKDELRKRQKELEEDEYIRNTCPVGSIY